MIPAMSSSPSPAAEARSPPDSQTLSSNIYPRRPLQRAGAQYFLSPAEQAMEDAMLRSSPPPEPVLGKRAHQNEEPQDRDDTEPEDPSPSTEQPASHTVGVVLATCKRYAAKKKLRTEQHVEVETFVLKDSALGRQAKLFALLMALENKIDAQQSAAPPYTLSEDLKTNINNYGIAVMLSINISAYKGNIPRNHVLDILKRYRFDLPPGIEHDYANWEKITTFVSYSLTQARSRVKKLIRDSIKTNTNIFNLAQLIVHGTPCRPTVQLCARVALMRAVFVECEGSEKYWNFIDQRLEFIRTKAGTSTAKVTRAFNAILKQDRAQYGTGQDYEIKDVVADDWQQRVDDVVGGTGAADLITGTAGAAAGMAEAS